VAAAIEQEIDIDAPVDAVWRAVTESEQIRRWFADEVDLEARSGYNGSLTFHDEDKASQRSRSFQVPCSPSSRPDRSPTGGSILRAPSRTWGTRRLSNSLSCQKETALGCGSSRTGQERMNWPQERQETFVEEHTHGWATYLGRLRSLVGRPAPDQVR
jgi:hypothetical protein